VETGATGKDKGFIKRQKTGIAQNATGGVLSASNQSSAKLFSCLVS
jgi:hypothetical protein